MTTRFPTGFDTVASMQPGGVNGQQSPQALMNALTAIVALEGAVGGGAYVRKASFTIANADVLALPTAAQIVVPAVAGSYIVPIAAVIHSTIVAPYADLENGYLVVSEDALVEASEYFDLSTAKTATLLGASGTFPLHYTRQGNASVIVGAPLYLFAINDITADFTGGDAGNSLTGEVYYYLIPTT